MRDTQHRLLGSILSPTTILLLSLAAFAVQFHSLRFTCDDAYISFRYARNIGDGIGPVFNADERVEGYTNPLWVYLLAFGELASIRPEILAQVLGFVAGSSTVVLSFFLARALAGGTRWALLAPLCLAGSYDHVAWSSSGLEMGLFLVLLLGAVSAAIHERKHSARPLSAVLAALAILTRPEGAVLGLVVGFLGIFTLKDRGLRLGIMALLLVPAAVFRIGYYHQLLPNTVMAKGGVEPIRGLFYFAEFLRSHPGVPIWALFTFLFRRKVRWIGILAVFHVLTLVMIGGDFMEFRLVVPVMVLAVSCAPYPLARLRPWLAWSLALTSVFGCWLGAITEYRMATSPYMIENVRELRQHARSWSRIGKFMNTAMRSHELIAVGPAGAIPYYSELPTLDMLGLCDAWVARHGEAAGNAAGHGKIAPQEYLEQRGVVWLVGQPDVSGVPDRGEDRISVWLPWSQYLVLGTTLNADSLRSVLRGRGFAVASPDTADMSMEGNRAVEQVITGWHLVEEGKPKLALRLARLALRRARGLGMEWRWLQREAGILELEARVRGGEVVRESKRWEEIEAEIPEEWRDAVAQAKAQASAGHLDSAGDKE